MAKIQSNDRFGLILLPTIAQRNISSTLFGNLGNYLYLCRRITVKTLMDKLQDIFRAIDADGFKGSTLLMIDNYIKDIENGRTNFPRFTQQEHAGLCKAGAALIGASVVASYARGSLTAGGDAESREGRIRTCILLMCLLTR